jgi:drug/metabolite transporter, DME family
MASGNRRLRSGSARRLSVAAVLLAMLAGASFGALTVAVQWGIRRNGDPHVGALVAAAVGAAASAAVAAPSAVVEGVPIGTLLPFFGAGLIAPGASQILLTLAVGHAGSSRAAILMGTAPLLSIVIALMLLGESFRPLLVVGTVLIVLGSVTLAGERTRPELRGRGFALAILCAALFAARDNVLRWAARNEHPPPPVAATASLLAAAALILVYLALMHRDHLRTRLRQAVPAFAPAGIAIALGYNALLAALDRGRVSVVSPLTATGSLWAVLLAALVIGRREYIGRRVTIAALLVVAGGAIIGLAR